MVAKLKHRNIGILITDHNVQETLSITDRAYLLFEGKILESGEPEVLAANADDPNAETLAAVLNANAPDPKAEALAEVV